MSALGLTLFLLMLAAPLGAQDAGPEAAEASIGLSDELQPAEIVAARVRRVLGSGRDGEAWKELAGSLPELALTGGADLESTFSAARVAEEMAEARSGVLVPGVATAAAGAPQAERTERPGLGLLVLNALKRVNVELAGTLLAFFVVVGVLWKSVRVGGQPSETPSAPPPPPDRIQEARAMAVSGTPVIEIVRRTGVSRDAVAVLMRMVAR